MLVHNDIERRLTPSRLYCAGHSSAARPIRPRPAAGQRKSVVGGKLGPRYAAVAAAPRGRHRGMIFFGDMYSDGAKACSAIPGNSGVP